MAQCQISRPLGSESDARPKDRAQTKYKCRFSHRWPGVGLRVLGRVWGNIGQHALVRRLTARLSADARAGFPQVACQTGRTSIQLTIPSILWRGRPLLRLLLHTCVTLLLPPICSLRVSDNENSIILSVKFQLMNCFLHLSQTPYQRTEHGPGIKCRFLHRWPGVGLILLGRACEILANTPWSGVRQHG